MPISINKSSINFGTYSISLHPDGIEIDGKFKYGSYATPPLPNSYGAVSGYTSGGRTPAFQNTIDKYSFTSDGDATDVGNLTIGSYGGAGQSSDTSGYTAGNNAPSIPFATMNTIDKFPFASDGNATDVGDLTQGRWYAAGQSSGVSGYSSGGRTGPALTAYDTIDKFPFAADGNATDVGNLTQTRYSSAGQSSGVSGYSSGGGSANTIDKFAFASDGNATDVGDLTVAATGAGGQSSEVSGYTSGGQRGGYSNVIDKFSFATDGNATDVGDLTIGKAYRTGTSSTTSGYTAGGMFPVSNVIDKFPFASDANGTDVGNLTAGRFGASGQQV